MNATAKKAEEKEEPFLLVEDQTATLNYPERTHEIVYDGKVKAFTFKYGEKQKMPVDLALKFLKHDAFVVTDPDTGNRYEPTPAAPDMGLGVKLQPGECVARYDELSLESLIVRAKQLPGGEKLNRNLGKQAVIDFILKQETAKLSLVKAGADEDVAAVRGGSSDGMTKAEVDKLFGDQA